MDIHVVSFPFRFRRLTILQYPFYKVLNYLYTYKFYHNKRSLVKIKIHISPYIYPTKKLGFMHSITSGHLRFYIHLLITIVDCNLTNVEKIGIDE